MHRSSVRLPDGRTVGVYDSGTPSAELTVLWHHGTPQIGVPPEPLLEPAARRGIRWIGIDRPGYGGSTAHPGRDVASVARDIAAVADELGLDRFAVIGASGGGPHALACSALLGNRVVAVVSAAGLAPHDADGLDWYAGMHPASEGELRASAEGREALVAFLTTHEFDPAMFTKADHAALAGDWAYLGRASDAGLEHGLDGIVDDDLAFVAPWGFAVTDVTAPVLLLHGVDDRVVPHSHSEWLAERLTAAALWSRPGESHVSVLTHTEPTLDWMLARV